MQSDGRERSRHSAATVPGSVSGATPLSAVSCKIPVKVVPGSSRTVIAGWLGDTLRVRVAAPPERGKANAAVEALLNKTLGLARGGARIVSGSTSQRKIVQITGLSELEFRQKLSDAGV